MQNQDPQGSPKRAVSVSVSVSIPATPVCPVSPHRLMASMIAEHRSLQEQFINMHDFLYRMTAPEDYSHCLFTIKEVDAIQNQMQVLHNQMDARRVHDVEVVLAATASPVHCALNMS